MRQATKQEEREILLKIHKLVSGFGSDSYIGAALDGCLELAQRNIENDELCSMNQRWMSAVKECQQGAQKLIKQKEYCEQLETKISSLQTQLEREQEWKIWNDEYSVSDADYEELKESCDEKQMGDDVAVGYIAELYGFTAGRIEICHEKVLYEINRHKSLRPCGTKERHPYCYASDWNYIRFRCGGYTWEMYNGELRNVS